MVSSPTHVVRAGATASKPRTDRCVSSSVCEPAPPSRSRAARCRGALLHGPAAAAVARASGSAGRRWLLSFACASRALQRACSGGEWWRRAAPSVLRGSCACGTRGCLFRYDKKFDPKAADWKKLRVKELRKICDDEGLDTKGLVEKEEYVKKIKAHFNIKDEV